MPEWKCEPDACDRWWIEQTIAIFQADGMRDSHGLILPDGDSDVRAAILGEICRDWLERNGYLNAMSGPTPLAKGRLDGGPPDA